MKLYILFFALIIHFNVQSEQWTKSEILTAHAFQILQNNQDCYLGPSKFSTKILKIDLGTIVFPIGSEQEITNKLTIWIKIVTNYAEKAKTCYLLADKKALKLLLAQNAVIYCATDSHLIAVFKSNNDKYIYNSFSFKRKDEGFSLILNGKIVDKNINKYIFKNNNYIYELSSLNKDNIIF